jgi:hypothetical protein
VAVERKGRRTLEKRQLDIILVSHAPNNDTAFPALPLLPRDTSSPMHQTTMRTFGPLALAETLCKSAGNSNGAADACSCYEADNRLIARGVCRCEIWAFETYGDVDSGVGDGVGGDGKDRSCSRSFDGPRACRGLG